MMSDIDPGTPANGGMSALTKREGEVYGGTRSQAMPQVTNEMVAEACFVYQQQRNMRAALEAALAVREPDVSDKAALIAKKLRYLCHPLAEAMPDGVRLTEFVGAGNKAADLIERQAEEIAELKADYLRRHKDACDRMEENIRLTAERAELIEALRPFSRAVYNDNGDVTVSHASISEYMRARALLERIGMMERPV